MPESLAPGVFVEETSSRQRSIEGVSTSTTAFVGPTPYGPEEGEPPLLTSFTEFERIYGGLNQLVYDDEAPSQNYVDMLCAPTSRKGVTGSTSRARLEAVHPDLSGKPSRIWSSRHGTSGRQVVFRSL